MYTLVKTMQRVIKKTSCFLFVFMLTSTLLYTSYVCASSNTQVIDMSNINNGQTISLGTKTYVGDHLINKTGSTISGATALTISGPGPYKITNNGTITGTQRSIYFEFTPSCDASPDSGFGLINNGLISGNIEVEKKTERLFLCYHAWLRWLRLWIEWLYQHIHYNQHKNRCDSWRYFRFRNFRNRGCF